MKSKLYASFRQLLTDEEGNLDLVLRVNPQSRYAARKIVADIRREGIDALTVALQEYRPQRSLDQNRMLWALLELLARHMNGGRLSGGVTAWDCYLDLLEDRGCKYEYFLCLPQALEPLRKEFRAVREVERRTYNGKEMIMCKCFYGSSTYDTKEMSELLEGLQDRLAELGIDSREAFLGEFHQKDL